MRPRRYVTRAGLRCELYRDCSGAERVRCAIGPRQLDAIDRPGVVEAWVEGVCRG